MICPNQSNRGPLKEKKEENECGSLPTADIVGAVGKSIFFGPNDVKPCYNLNVDPVLNQAIFVIIQTLRVQGVFSPMAPLSQ